MGFRELFDLKDRTVVITGGAGVLGAEMGCALVECGANVVVLDRCPEMADPLRARLGSASSHLLVLAANVLDRSSLEQACEVALAKFGRVDGLINAAGGNDPRATTQASAPFFSIPPEALRWVVDLNLLGTILPSQVFGRVMASQKSGAILNVSSMNASRPLTRIPAYSAAKAAVSNFTQWLAVHLAQEYSPDIRVNAIAPGFFLTEQNRFLLTDRDTGELTDRGKSIVAHTPMGRFGSPADLVGAVLWLLSPASVFVTGTVVPVDGGFGAYAGV
ncbi:SDR family oxidoreductase [Myxococcota bacterium]